MFKTVVDWGVGILVASVVCVSVWGCSGNKEKVVAAGEIDRLNFIEAYDNARFDNSDLKKQVYDMNGDMHVDLWKFYTIKKMAKDETKLEYVLTRKELDLNFDGRIDRIMYYNTKENLIREEIDTNFDGTIDRIHYYDDGIIVKTEFYQLNCNTSEIDQPGPEVNPDLERHYRKGVLTREESDEQCDGAHERITIFNGEGNISQVGLDYDGDGVVDNWIRY